MDQRKIDSILYDLNEEKQVIINILEAVERSLNDTTKTEKEREELTEEQLHLKDELHDVEIDIAIYQEMMNKMFPIEIGACGYYCDNQCRSCIGGYDSRYEVFTEGDY